MRITKGTKVFITGAGSGIGRSTAIECAKRGARLFLTDINAAGLAETADLATRAGGLVVATRALDVSNYEEYKAFAEEILAAHGAMEVLMNIAGIALYALVDQTTHQHWQKLINVNLWGPIHALEFFIPGMIEAKAGHIVNVASMSGLVGAPVHSAYAAAKFGLVGISEVLQWDLMRHHISTTVVCPGAVDTPLKDTVEILGVNPDGPGVKEMKRRFTAHAVTPENVARQIMDAVEKKKFLVITSWDVRFAYFAKHFIPPLYRLIMLRITRLLEKLLDEPAPDQPGA